MLSAEVNSELRTSELNLEVGKGRMGFTIHFSIHFSIQNSEVRIA